MTPRFQRVPASREGRCCVDRCALFVDAGYMLADGAMAVHGTRRRESVSWDYEGLGAAPSAIWPATAPVSRCCGATGTSHRRGTAYRRARRALADMPGINGPGQAAPGTPRRRGDRDPTAISRSWHGIGRSATLWWSAPRKISHRCSPTCRILACGSPSCMSRWTATGRSPGRSARSATTSWSSPARTCVPTWSRSPAPSRPCTDEQYPAGALSARSTSNGHSNGSAGSDQALSSGSGPAGPPSIYTAPVVAEYQRSPQPIAPSYRHDPEPEPPARDDPAAGADSPLAFGRPEAPAESGVTRVPERAEPAGPEPPRPEPGRGDAPGTDVRRGDLPSAGMRGDLDRGGFDAREPAQRDRGDRDRADRGQSDPGVSPQPSPAGRNDAGETEPPCVRTCTGRRCPCRSGVRPRRCRRPRTTCPAVRGVAGTAVRSHPATSPSRPGLPRGLSHRRARQAQPARHPRAARPPASTPVASGAPGSRPPTGAAERRTSSAGNRSIHTASEYPRRRDRSGARGARPRPRRWGPHPARRPRRIRPRATGHRGRGARQRRELR